MKRWLKPLVSQWQPHLHGNIQSFGAMGKEARGCHIEVVAAEVQAQDAAVEVGEAAGEVAGGAASARSLRDARVKDPLRVQSCLLVALSLLLVALSLLLVALSLVAQAAGVIVG